MHLEWAIGEIIVLAFCFYELWSLNRYDRKHPKGDGSKQQDDRGA